MKVLDKEDIRRMEIDAAENEISLLDLLLVVAENLKLLIVGPVMVGLLALGISYALPQSFTSQAILALPASTSMPMPMQMQMQMQMPTPTQAAAMMGSPLVLDLVVESLKSYGGQTIQVASRELAKQIKATVGKDGMLRLDVTANTPTEAQTIANAVIDAWLKGTAPGDRDRADLEKRLAHAKVGLESVRRFLDRRTAEDTANLNKALTRGEADTTIVAAGELQARYLDDVLNIPRWLQGFSRDIVKQPPTLPAEPVAPKKSLIAVLAALGSGFALLLWVFLRQAWKNAAQDPEGVEKQAKLRAAIGFKSRRD